MARFSRRFHRARRAGRDRKQFGFAGSSAQRAGGEGGGTQGDQELRGTGSLTGGNGENGEGERLNAKG